MVRGDLDRRDLDRGDLDRRDLDRRDLDRRDLDRRDLDRRDLDRRHLDRRDLDRRHLDRRHLDRRHLDRGRLAMRRPSPTETTEGAFRMPTPPRRVRQRALVGLLLMALLAALLASPAGAKSDKKKDRSLTIDTTEEVAATSTDGPRGRVKRERTEADATTPTATAVEEPVMAVADAEPATVADPSSVYDPAEELGSLYNVVDQIGARDLWRNGFTGEGIDMAVIDTGVTPVPALSGADKVVAMVDLSFEAGVPEAQYLDTNGHGTHMTGIIAGRDPGADPATARRPTSSSASPPTPASSASRSATTPEPSTSRR